MNNSDASFGLSSNILKIIAAVSMLIDHIGVILFPSVRILRIIGRIAFPIFAFMIAEGCFYTRQRLRYFLSVFTLGAACQAVLYLYSKSTYMGILITFSVSILLIYALDAFKYAVCDRERAPLKRLALMTLFPASVALTFFLCRSVTVDYGFFGCMAPVFASLPKEVRKASECPWRAIDRRHFQIISLGIGLFLLALTMRANQLYSLLAIPLLLLYSGKRGKLKMKYFFYIFYPLHLLAIEIIAVFLR